MTEQIHLIFSTWNNYWGTGSFHWMLLVSILFLVIFHRKSPGTIWTVPYTLLVLAVFFFPLSAAIIQKCVGSEVYWRTLWLLPTIPVIALACVEFLTTIQYLFRKRNIYTRIKKVLPTTALILITSAAAVLCTREMLHSDHYHKVSNYQKVPEEVAQICNLIRTYADGQTVKLATDDNIASYVRVYDASILMPYGRRGDGAAGEAARELYQLMSVQSPKFKRIAALAKKTGCNFLVIVLYSDSESERLAQNGYQQIGTINNYGIFQYTEERED